VKVEIILYAFTVYVGVILAVVLFGDEKRAKRAQDALHELLSVIRKNGSGK
jgi:hypothetical protein